MKDTHHPLMNDIFVGLLLGTVLGLAIAVWIFA